MPFFKNQYINPEDVYETAKLSIMSIDNIPFFCHYNDNDALL